MTFGRGWVAGAVALIVAGFASAACAEQNQSGSDVGAVEEHRVDIISEGVRIHADVYAPTSAPPGPLPTIVMSHGWGGTAAMLRAQASAFASAGYLVVAFDYRGWGESDARVILTRPAPERSGQRYTAEVKEVREVVDPIDQATDILNVIHWAMGEPQVDRRRVGLWGTSFSGGLVIYVAARDPRIKALVSQVGYMGQPIAAMSAAGLAKDYDDATRRARGQLGYPAPRAREIGNLQGGPIREKFLVYAPIDDVAQVKGALLLIAAENEELFDNRSHPEAAYQRAHEPKRYVVIPGIAHYGIYREARDEATRLAIEWFDQHLKPRGQ